MVEISDKQPNFFQPRQPEPPARQRILDSYTPKGREVYDTIELSDGAKQINLARSDQLAAEIRAETDPDKVRELVREGTEDINRIAQLFREVMKEIQALFAPRRGN